MEDEELMLSSGEKFEDYCERTFEDYLDGNLFPYSLRETYSLAYDTLEEAEERIVNEGVEGFSYHKCEDGDYALCMQSFTEFIVLHEKTLVMLEKFCNGTYRELINTYDIPFRYETKRVMGADGRWKIVQVPVPGYHPKNTDPRFLGFMKASGDLAEKVAFERFLKEAGFTWTTEEIAASFDMPEEGLLASLAQSDVIVHDADDEENCSWELTEAYKGEGLTLMKDTADGKSVQQWTYKGFFFIWLLLTRDYEVRPCCEKQCK